jgi:hypothetical protein
MLAHGRHFYGIFATDNAPNPANFPYGVRYQRNVNFATQQLLDLTNTIVIPPSIDPFFFEITFGLLVADPARRACHRGDLRYAGSEGRGEERNPGAPPAHSSSS